MKKGAGVLVVFILGMMILSSSFVSAGLVGWFGDIFNRIDCIFFEKCVGQSPKITEDVVCGDGIVDPGEECDQENLTGQNCISLSKDFDGGNLKCFASGSENQCKFDTSGCWTNSCNENEEGVSGTFEGVEYNSLDECQGKDVLEYFCEGSLRGTQILECEEGSSCLDGKCAPTYEIEAMCEDSDLGINLTVQGIVLWTNESGTINRTDECENEEVVEFYCGEEEILSVNENCGEGFNCINGACLEGSGQGYGYFNSTNGTINVTSDPSGARIEDNGVEIGLTPKVYDVEPGEHKITLTKEGYLPFSDEVNLESGEVEEVYGELDLINSNKTGELADIKITKFEARVGAKSGASYPVMFSTTLKNEGDANAGESTTRFLIMQNGKFINVRTEGINESQLVEINGTINVTSGGNYTAFVFTDAFNEISESNESNNNRSTGFIVSGGTDSGSNKNSSGTINVTSDPSGARIEDNGVEIGLTPKVYDVEPGEHGLIIKKEGFNDFSRTLQVRSGSLISIHASLQRKETCVDSDQGKEYLVWGETSNEGGGSSDSCEDGKILKEFYCENGNVIEEKKNCLDLGEYECKEGICVDASNIGFIEKIMRFLKDTLGL